MIFSVTIKICMPTELIGSGQLVLAVARFELILGYSQMTLKINFVSSVSSIEVLNSRSPPSCLQTSLLTCSDKFRLKALR